MLVEWAAHGSDFSNGCVGNNAVRNPIQQPWTRDVHFFQNIEFKYLYSFKKFMFKNVFILGDIN